MSALSHVRPVRSALLTAVLLAGGLAALPATAASATIVQCPAGSTYHWDGSANDSPGKVGDGRSWADAYNWDLDCTPGLVKDGSGNPKPQDDHVTIGSGADVTLFDGEQGAVADLHNAGTLTVTAGAAINSRLDSTSAHLVLKGLLFGTATFTVTGTLDWVSTAQGAATMSTRRCAVVDCSGAAPSPGRTLIARGARMNVSGRGVALIDQRVIENRGKIVVSGQGYIAADYGTTLRNLRLPGAPAPQFDFQNDGGYYQGFATAGQTLGRFVNTGVVLKSKGSGRSVIDAAYARTDPATSATGTVQVRTGTLFITTAQAGGADAALVQQGAAFGNGGRNGPTTGDPSTASVQLTKPGSALVPVTLQELPPVPGGRGTPVEIMTPGASATPAQPLRFRLFLDRSARRGSETAHSLAQSLPAFRAPDGSNAYVALPSCGPSGPTAASACVDRARSVSETDALTTGDIVIVIDSLQNSRYRV